jgi:hypothetical protein
VSLQLDVPQLPCSRVIATALASTIRHSPESSSVSQPDWSSLLALEEETDRGEAEGTGATDSAALEKQVVPSGAEHGLDSNDLATTHADTKGASSNLLASGRSYISK